MAWFTRRGVALKTRDFLGHLNIHKTPENHVYALSLLPAAVELRATEVISGWIQMPPPALLLASPPELTTRVEEDTPTRDSMIMLMKKYPLDAMFVENPRFITLLHRILAKYGPDDPSLQLMAHMSGDTWLHVADERKLHQWGKTPSPEDILGTFRVEGKRILHTSYIPMPTHRLITATHGAFRLSRTVHQHLVQELERVNHRHKPMHL